MNILFTRPTFLLVPPAESNIVYLDSPSPGLDLSLIDKFVTVRQL